MIAVSMAKWLLWMNEVAVQLQTHCAIGGRSGVVASPAHLDVPQKPLPLVTRPHSPVPADSVPLPRHCMLPQLWGGGGGGRGRGREREREGEGGRGRGRGEGGVEMMGGKDGSDIGHR